MAGDLVATAYGHATAHLSDPGREHVVPLPPDLDPLLGVFVAHFGPICANGLLHAAADATDGAVSGLADGVSGPGLPWWGVAQSACSPECSQPDTVRPRSW